MTNLPRYSEGSFGKLDFAALNEMMKRLDLLLPLAEKAASGGGVTITERPAIFPCYAVRSEFKLDQGADENEIQGYKYDWSEITLVGNAAAWTQPTGSARAADPGNTNLRSGTAIESEEEGEAGTFGILPDPKIQNFSEGYAIAFAVRMGGGDDEKEESIQGGVRYLLFPMMLGTGKVHCEIMGEGSIGEVTIKEGGTDTVRTCYEYPARILSLPGDGTLEAGDDCVLIDLNCPAANNKPTIEGAEVNLPVRLYDAGTIFAAEGIGSDEDRSSMNRYVFTHLPRFNVGCE